jgi:glyoxylase-like metal-dependent hydrolase (beta-lactamase superfamily II)
MRLTRRRFLVSVSAATASAGVLSRVPAWAQQTTAGSFTALRGNIGVFDAPRSGGTIGWFIGKQSVLVVDSKGPDFAQACIDGIASRTDRKIDALINTHHHGDHTGGNAVFRKVVGKIVGHENVPELQRKAAEQRDNLDGQEYADVTYAAEWSMDLGGETVSLKHHGPAHTGGDSVVHFENANIVHLGDLVFNRWCPFIDRDGGASVAGWIDTLGRTIKAHDDETIYIFGHGEESFGITGSSKDLAVQRDYLEWVWETTAKGIAAGKTPEQIAEPGLPEAFSDHVELNERLGVLGNVKVAFAEQGEQD